MHAVLGRIENYNSQRRVTFALVSFKAGTAVTAGTVLAILPFSRLTIRVGGHVAMLIVVPVYMHAVRKGQLLMFHCPGTSSDSSPAICQIHFSIASLWYRLLLFCYVTDDMESRSQ